MTPSAPNLGVIALAPPATLPCRSRAASAVDVAVGAPSVWQSRGAWTRTTSIAKVAAGDQAAFAALYDELAPSVFGVVRRVLRDPSQAEEVTQEVFVEIWRQAARFDPQRGSVRTWAVTIAHRRAVDRVRSEQAHRDRQLRVGADGRRRADAGGRRAGRARTAARAQGRARRAVRRSSARRWSWRSTTG